MKKAVRSLIVVVLCLAAGQAMGFTFVGVALAVLFLTCVLVAREGEPGK